MDTVDKACSSKRNITSNYQWIVGEKANIEERSQTRGSLVPFAIYFGNRLYPKMASQVNRKGNLAIAIWVYEILFDIVNDSLFFVKPDSGQMQTLKILLSVFKLILELSINMDKSKLLLGDQTGNSDHLLSILGCKRGTYPYIYLGLPLSDKNLPKSTYMSLIQKVNNRLQGWAAKQLSILRKMVLLNAVLSSIATYLMSAFKIPVWVTQKIDETRRKFFWKKNLEEQKGISLANWEIICKPKKFGGLGIIDLQIFNEALLTKWCWQWIKLEMRLWKSFFTTTYEINYKGEVPNC